MSAIVTDEHPGLSFDNVTKPDVTIAQGKPKIEPDCMSDDVGR
jgi:hypothetical protein